MTTETLQIESGVKDGKKRNYSFLGRNQEGLDSAVGWDNKEFPVPATPGTWYWAIIKYCYERHDRPMKMEEIIDGSTEIYAGRDPEKFEEYKSKDRIKTRKNGSVVQREANHWRKRVETNVKTLTRHGGNNPYGQRLRERGHILRWESQHFGGRGGFVLRTDTDQPLRRGKGKEEQRLKKNVLAGATTAASAI